LGVFCPGASVPFTGGGASFNDTANGWTAGAGLEIAFARHWTAAETCAPESVVLHPR
jgi:hypothetical protein